MIEIVVLYFLLKNIGKLAKEKGQSSMQWMVFGFLAWICGELSGIVLVLNFIGQEYFIFSMFFGIGMAYLFFLIVKSKLQGLPDSEN
ncbi:hypothetical protein [Sporocytophaga myxococcoides]|uniref:hypothetical protein n=1 Tax=Sporocytophaga myxococcoides TaxID=153721 RepID=UPI00041C5795|nr:hypothetical protein [Sporocytophaga myxococcoides]